MACGRVTRAARRPAPATPARGCGSWAGRRTRKQPGTRRLHEAHHALAARLLGVLAEWESELGRTEYGLRLLDCAESLTAAG